MDIGGFQKTSLLDYPLEVSAIIWTVGCNFSCPFCYNVDIVKGTIPLISEDEIFSYLCKRKNMLDAVVITGGEPFLQKDLKDFCSKLKKIGYLIKIDTNGTFPDKLKELFDEGLVDYVAMDIKAPKEKYHRLAGVSVNIKQIEKSIDLIKRRALDYEFRTTFVPGLLTKEDIEDIGRWLSKSKRFFLQECKSDTALLSLDGEDINPYSEQYLTECIQLIQSFFDECSLRKL
ncbi:MAG: anaerobic ribonucleoside-triphosphate reductase activating protein [Thermoplasmatota archaeon]